MNTVKVDILNPKAAKILKNLADLNLIKIQGVSTNGFADLLKKLRSQSASAPSLEEITQEVEMVRMNHYAKS